MEKVEMTEKQIIIIAKNDYIVNPEKYIKDSERKIDKWVDNKTILTNLDEYEIKKNLKLSKKNILNWSTNWTNFYCYHVNRFINYLDMKSELKQINFVFTNEIIQPFQNRLHEFHLKIKTKK